jgi:hypothetical protein
MTATPPPAASHPAFAGPDDCQLHVLPVATTSLGLPDTLRHLSLRLGSAARRRVAWVAKRVGFVPGPPAAPASVAAAAALPDGFAEGQRVRVLPLTQIRALLDDQGRTGGMTFMAGMERFCGHELTVRKRVRTIFDERHDRMLRLRRAYLLEGVICDGRQQYDREGCDRACFYFWKEPWLEAV